MSTVTEHSEHADTAADDVAHEHESHFSDKQYVLVAVFLAVLTAIEVSTYYVDFGPLFMPTLFALMIIKFLVVVSFFMHLKFDNKLFSWMFYSGLVLAIAVYIGALATFQFFLS